ncbi:CBS domain-containing protein [Glaciecola sp. 2405UD65-10]|uniref:CBS domain-containing protein n=1 Tax=Glaciecola sp. 2405UD65-10 TaxID=3397244 RepID=UPI003B5B79F4
MKNLPLRTLNSIDTLAWPNNTGCVTHKTPALSILTDFTQHFPLVVTGDVKAIELEKMMKQSHVKMKLVVDDHNKFIGLVTLFDVNEENILKKVDKNMPRNELTVRDFMHNRESLKCFDFHDLANATVGDVLATQRENHLQHCLVIDSTENTIRGVISARDIARLLSPNVSAERHFSFEDLFNEITPRMAS